ncbi:MAG: DUF4301 family protein [Flavobacteriaceae bacterium]|nr:DUF4301 family protein [Flavobacteriaceae bacterium]
MLTEKDIEQIQNYGLSINQVFKQIETFTKGIPFANVVTTATINNGIHQISEDEKQQLESFYEKNKAKLDIVKFVPASGAATRMFKFLHEFVANYNPEKEKFRDFVKRNESSDLITFFESSKEFAFINLVRKAIRKNYPDYKKSSKGQRLYYVAKTLLEKNGLNYGNLPKGLIPFHKYKKYATTAFEEQLYESAFYASAQDDIYLHFTFSEEHLDAFKKEFAQIKSRVERKTKKTIHISYSFQKKTTDTIAVTPDNKPYRNENGQLVFRPSGHGALLENLNEIDADIVFIKNIDNVAAQEYVEEIAFHKKVLAGKLLQIQRKVFGYLKELQGEITLDKMKEIQTFIWNEMDIKELPNGITGTFNFLNRPIRVCGVVENTGEPGGGPFWVKNSDDVISLQIVEKSQIDLKNFHQKSIIKEATHFNPVDIVCGLRDFEGNKFDLSNYVDNDAGFISNKSENGKEIKALELPGLWNGSMARWNTIFVEVPAITFNPVKTVNDLLKRPHRPNA